MKLRFTGTILLLFSVFIIWIIYLANTGKQSVFFDLVKIIPYGDKIGHFFLFGVLTFLANLASRFKTFKIGNFSFYFGTAIVTFLVIFEELSQGVIPTRTLDITDLLFDFTGIAVFTFCNYHLKKNYIKTNRYNT